MSQQNVELVRSAYAAFNRGDLEAVFRIFDENIVFNMAENSPYYAGKPYVGPKDLTENLFARLGAETEGFTIVEEAVHDAGGVVVVQGRYRGRNLNTGLSMDLQMCHIWTVRDSRLVRMDQYVDTLKAREVYGAFGRFAASQ